MKKLYKAILSLALILIFVGTSTFSPAATAASMTLTKAAVVSAAEEYLRACTSATYFHDGSDVNKCTIANADFAAAAISEATDLAWFTDRNTFSLMADVSQEPITYDTMLSDLNTQAARVAYYARVYENGGYEFDYFDMDYTTADIQINGSYALVNIYEELNYKYVFCDEPSYEMYHYNLALLEVNGDWVIADIISDDPFFLGNRGQDFDLEKAIAGLDAAKKAAIAEEPVIALDTEVSEISASSIVYNRQNAANYALTYTTTVDTGPTPSFYNKAFYLPTASCMAFASQCVWAGFGGSNYSTDIANKQGMDAVGTNDSYKWWSTKYGCTNSWSSCAAFNTYVQNSEPATDMGLFCDSDEILAATSHLPCTASQLIGAVLHVKGYNNGSPVKFGHAVVVNNATSNSRSGVYVCSYNNCKKNVTLESAWPASTTDSYQAVRTIVPLTFRNAYTGVRLWGGLQNVFVDKTATRTLTGYSSTTLSSFQMVLLNPSNVPVCDWSWTNKSSVSATYSNFNVSGEWHVKLIGTDKSGNTYTHYYTLRVA